MSPLPEMIIAILAPLAGLFSAVVWSHAQVLMIGAILCQGPRTVTAALRVLGLGQEPRFERYHRVLNRTCWSGLQAAQILLGLVIQLLPRHWVPLMVVDDTVERRRGKRIHAKGCYRDAVRSTPKHVVKCFGLKWVCLMLLVRLPWSSRLWALPFFTVLAPSESANHAVKKRHKTTVDWTCQMVKAVSRWLRRPWVLLGDGSFACLQLGWTCVQHHVVLISRLRLDAQLYAFPTLPVRPRRGPKPRKGPRLPALQARVAQAQRSGEEVEIDWYGGEKRRVRWLSDVALWYRRGQPPLPIRWVLVVNAEGDPEPAAFFCTCPACEPRWIITAFVLRWNIEVTFEESRRHLGLETQRQWSNLAITRTTPALFGLFSLVCLMAHRLTAAGATLMPRTTAWYAKAEVTFSDVLAFVRRTLWAHQYFSTSVGNPESLLFPQATWEAVLDQLATPA
ncbi:MAG TPA: transposase [Candidatus Competibacteraceae bacterium]|nr:transposase [Candidatus Competibacteraceae bacterium]